jgi:hypothetical protein
MTTPLDIATDATDGAYLADLWLRANATPNIEWARTTALVSIAKSLAVIAHNQATQPPVPQ